MQNTLDNKLQNTNSGKEGFGMLDGLFTLTAIGASAIIPAVTGFKIAHNSLESNPELSAKMIAGTISNMIVFDCMGVFGAYTRQKGTGRYALVALTALQAASYGVGYGAGWLTRGDNWQNLLDKGQTLLNYLS